jgi:hypothetical protein
MPMHESSSRLHELRNTSSAQAEARSKRFRATRPTSIANQRRRLDAQSRACHASIVRDRDRAFSDLAPWRVGLSPPWSIAFDLAAASVVATVFAIVLATFRDYGVTWDESWHVEYGDQILAWFTTFGADTSALCYRVDFLYGGGFDLLGAIVRRFSPLSALDTMHLLGPLVGVLGLVGAWRLARRLAGPAAGFVAVVLLATTPVYYGHMFNNPKDLPFAVGYVWALDALVAILLQMPRVPRRAWIRFAVIAGLAMGVRIAGILLLVYLGAIVLGMAWLRARNSGSLRAGLLTARRLGGPALLAMIGAWAVMVSTWPWALLDPIRRPWIALGNMSRYKLHERRMPFAGEWMKTTEPRWDYLPHYFGLNLPLVVLALVLVAVGLVAHAWWRRRLDIPQRNTVLVLAMAIMAPPTYVIVLRSIVYDGMRHVLFLVPPIAVVAAIGAVLLARRLSGAWRVALAITLAAGVARQIVAMRELHPHQYIYFNEIIGGLPGAYGNYDTEYYGNSYKEGFAALADHLWRTEPEKFRETRYLVTGCIPDFVAAEYLHANFDWVDDKDDTAEFYISYTRSRCHERFAWAPEIMRVERMGTLLLLVRDLRGGRKGVVAGEPVTDEEEAP